MAASAVAAVLGLLGACESTHDGLTPTNDGVSSIQFEDIPVPNGLKLHERRHGSDSVVVGDYRYGNFLYSGSVPIAEAASYLRERMPQHAWELVADNTDELGTTTLQFRRGKYRAECKLGRNADKTATQLTVTVRTTLEDTKTP